MEKDIWIFLSHSNKDYELVKRVRNKLEDAGRRPIMFFLKCLDDHAEVWELIKREIDVRPRFILCKSKNTEDANGWVQKEFNYIKEQHKPYEIVDFNNLDSLEKSIDSLIKRSKVFISYSYDNLHLNQLLKQELITQSFDVINCEHIQNSISVSPIQEEISNVLGYTAENGYVVCLWSKPLGYFQRYEFETAVRKKGNNGFICPFVTDKSAYVDMELYNECADWHGVIRVKDVSQGTNIEKVQNIVTELKRLDALKNNR